MKDVVAHRTKLLKKLGLQNPDAYAAQLDPDCLTHFGMLRLAWNEIPASNDAEWMKQWISEARGHEDAEQFISAYDRMIAAGVKNEDLTTLIRAALGQFLFRFSNLLDDNYFEEPELRDNIHFGVWAETTEGEPTNRLGCIHELVFEADPENTERA